MAVSFHQKNKILLVISENGVKRHPGSKGPGRSVHSSHLTVAPKKFRLSHRINSQRFDMKLVFSNHPPDGSRLMEAQTRESGTAARITCDDMPKSSF
jgi:hypothetical protein